MTTVKKVLSELYLVSNTKIGTVYFYEKFCIIEMKEGSTVNYENSKELFELIMDFFEDKHFGIISNRINSYSINLSDASKMTIKNVAAYSAVTYSTKNEQLLEIERQFCKTNRLDFKDLESAEIWTLKQLENY